MLVTMNLTTDEPAVHGWEENLHHKLPREVKSPIFSNCSTILSVKPPTRGEISHFLKLLNYFVGKTSHKRWKLPHSWTICQLCRAAWSSTWREGFEASEAKQTLENKSEIKSNESSTVKTEIKDEIIVEDGGWPRDQKSKLRDQKSRIKVCSRTGEIFDRWESSLEKLSLMFSVRGRSGSDGSQSVSHWCFSVMIDVTLAIKETYEDDEDV